MVKIHDLRNLHSYTYQIIDKVKKDGYISFDDKEPNQSEFDYLCSINDIEYFSKCYQRVILDEINGDDNINEGDIIRVFNKLSCISVCLVCMFNGKKDLVIGEYLNFKIPDREIVRRMKNYDYNLILKDYIHQDVDCGEHLHIKYDKKMRTIWLLSQYF